MAIKNSKSFFLELLKTYNSSILNNASLELLNSKEFCLEAVKINGWALKYVSEELKNCKEICLEAVK